MTQIGKLPGRTVDDAFGNVIVDRALKLHRKTNPRPCLQEEERNRRIGFAWNRKNCRRRDGTRKNV